MMPDLELVPVASGKRSTAKILAVVYLCVVVWMLASKWIAANDERQRQAAFLASRMNKLTDDSYAVRIMVEHLSEAQIVKSTD